ncbi:MFS transporter [Nibrella saemangeumensis]|uniref:MFS transporter n=1 Tax=Nibrella saemangeumensis TaxID=1084526 RepID=A0ABP8MP02_9BACT
MLGLNEAQLGTVLFAMPLGLILTLPVTGMLIGRYNSRAVLLAGALAVSGILSVMGWVNQTWQLAFMLFCFGAARNMLSISVNAQSVSLQAMYDRSIISSFHGIWSVSGFAGAGLGALMVALNIAPSYHFLGVSLLLMAVAILLFPYTLPEPPTRGAVRSGFVLPDKTLVKFGMMSFAAMACEGTLYDWGAVYFQKAVQAPKAYITMGLIVYMIAMTVGRFSGDWLVNQFSQRVILRASGLLMTAGLLLAAAWPSLLPASIGFIMVGFGGSCVIPLVMRMATTQDTGAATGSVITAVSTVSYFGFLIVPPIIGFLAEALNLRWSFALMSLFGVVIIWLVGRVK